MNHIFNLSKSVKILKVNKNISNSKIQSFFNQTCSDKKVTIKKLLAINKFGKPQLIIVLIVILRIKRSKVSTFF
ncbi:hypothetical protein CBF30_10910 [Vagococcus entomophilus]|uniref:Uncharacterized protein n=1 Tax=Vagococcus entomophilus TaxID=1160095 RepID=A0A430AF40_9ENTE|nr:hypothetical protein CBF30_10910 [Vagococcus entomophilus]